VKAHITTDSLLEADDFDRGSATIVPLGGMLTSSPSTNTGLGMRMPSRAARLEQLLATADALGTTAARVINRPWVSFTSTNTGIVRVPLPQATTEVVRGLRDEISRRTRLSRAQIARALGVDRRSLTSWVNGSSVPGPDRLERLRHLAALVREVDVLEPGRTTEIMLLRRRGGDLLDLIASGRFAEAHDWRSLEPGAPSVRTTGRSRDGRKPALFGAAFAAYQAGRLSVPPRSRTVRSASEYEQDLDGAEAIFPDATPAVRRGRYR
jgi:transcriptional regulator with XRE-family HTH domain